MTYMKISIRYTLFVILALATSNINAQTGGPDDPAQKLVTGADAFQKQYEKNIKKTRIDGVYIPINLEEAFEELANLADDSSLVKFKAADEQTISRKLHFGLGRWIMVYWNLEEGSRYEHHLRSLGLIQVDDMIQFTIVSFHRHLRGTDLEVEERVAEYKKKLEEKLESRRQKSEVISTETRSIKE